MNTHEIFDLAIQAEEKLSECYKEISQLCQDKSISEELMILSKEEIDHRNLLITGTNYLNEAPDLFEDKSDGISELTSALAKCSRLIEDCRKKNIHIEEALNDMVDLERHLEEYHLKKISEVNDDSLKKLFEALSSGDRLHKERLMKIIMHFATKAEDSAVSS